MSRKQLRDAAKLNRTQSDSRTGTTTPIGSAVTELLAAGVRHHQAGRLAEAAACYRWVLAALPNHAEIHSNLGVALKGQGKLQEAIVAYRQAIRFKPDYAVAHSNLGNALKDQGKLDEAIASYRRAILSCGNKLWNTVSIEFPPSQQNKLQSLSDSVLRSLRFRSSTEVADCKS